MGCIPSKPIQRAKILAPDFRIKHKKPDLDEEFEVFRDFLLPSPEEFIQLNLEKNELWQRRILIYGLSVETATDKEFNPIIKS